MAKVSERKDLYRELCKTEPTIPLFSRDWWLDAVCGESNWDVNLVLKGGMIVGSMPYYMVKGRRKMAIKMPPLTISMGPWVRSTNAIRNEKKIKNENEIITELIEGLPPFYFFNQRLHYSVTNWLPFYWKGFEQTTRYSYIIPDISDLDKVYRKIEHGVRGPIEKTQDVLSVEVSEDIQTFYDINASVFTRQGMAVPYTFDFIKNLDMKCRERGVRRLLVAKDQSGIVQAVKYFVWDENSAYALMSGYNPDVKSGGAQRRLTWEAIKIANTVVGRYDFLGSMLASVERVNRNFGAIQVPYFSISKTNSLHLKLFNPAKDATLGLIRR